MSRAWVHVFPLLSLAVWGCEVGPTPPTAATSAGATSGATTSGAATIGSTGSTGASSGTTASTASSGTSTSGVSTGSIAGASSGSTGAASTASTATTGASGSSGSTASSTSSGSTTGSAAYTVTDLGPAQVESINNAGQVAGETCASGQCLAAVWQAGTGWVSTPLPSGGSASSAVGVDQAGDLAMNVTFPWGMGGSYTRGYTSRPTQPIPTTAPEGGSNLVNAIDFATGHIVGYDRGLGGGFLFDGTTMTPIAAQPGSDDLGDPLGAHSQATAINAADQVAGWVRTLSSTNAPEHAFVWQQGNLTDLGTLGEDARSAAVAIDDSGAVVGWSKPGTEGVEGRRIFLWDGSMHDLGCPSDAITCMPSGMNAQGDLVGTAQDSLAAEMYPFIYRNGQFTRLDALVQNASGWSFEDVRSINDSGQIVGTGLLNGSPHAFLLNP